MATTTEKYYILQNAQGMFLQGLHSHENGKNDVKSIGLDIKYCDDPLHAARGRYEGKGEDELEELAKIAEFVDATPRVLEITAEVKTTDGKPAPEPDYEAADRLVRSKDNANFKGLAGIFAGLRV